MQIRLTSRFVIKEHNDQDIQNYKFAFFFVTVWNLVSFINLLAPELFFFLILAQPIYKMWIIQELNTLELWNRLHFEEEKTVSICNV